MSYPRVIPRDLFNEANLLKCYGQIYIALETAKVQNVDVELLYDGEPFDVQQDDSCGSTYVANVILKVRGISCKLQRPMNSREKWPLYLIGADEEETAVFDDDGSFSSEMLEFLHGTQN
jgi:hypothetical protein